MKKLIVKVALVSFMFLNMYTQILANEIVPPLYTVEDFFSFPDELRLDMMPDGNRLLFSAPVDGVINLFTRDINTDIDTQITFEKDNILFHFAIGDTILFMTDNYSMNRNLFRANADGSTTNMTPFENAMVTPLFHITLPNIDEKNEVLLRSNHENVEEFNIYRLDVITGDLVLVHRNAQNLWFDNAGVNRIMSEQDMATGNTIFFHRFSENDNFEYAATISSSDSFGLIAFNYSNEYIYATTNIDRNFVSLVKVDPVSMDIIEYIFEPENEDITGVGVGFLSPGILDFVRYNNFFENKFSEFIFFNPYFEEIYNDIASNFSDNSIISFYSRSFDNNAFFIFVTSDRNPGQMFMFNRANDTLTKLTDRAFTNSENFAPMKSITYTSRDGLEIQGFLVIPVGLEPNNLPTVVIPPLLIGISNLFGYTDYVQFLANRGYAVFLPSTRGTFGFGREFLELGYGQLGLGIQNDITDGVLYLIEQGIADSERIAIFGQRIGGLTALMSAIEEPDLYAAIIAMTPITNLFEIFNTIPDFMVSEIENMQRQIGHPVIDYDRLRAASPVFHAERISTPLLMAHGAEDAGVNLLDSISIIQSLENRGIENHFMIRFNESNDFIIQENTIQFYSLVEAFLARHLGGRTTTNLEDLAD
ncbi:MAG: prolyl oligopeptidase family serine peptidase [Defluviitaleaceae bacterium]|nr:prolyl oligopeptidase family serine peptidase [Defluviitaleaceae bacterium]